MADFGAAEWDACAGGNPFVSHAFLSALEESGSVGRGTGWHPRLAALRDDVGGLVGCAPLYAKTHSYGEYVFDQGWADALAGAGGEYYPKLQVAAPFSPVPGPRLLLRPDSTVSVEEFGGALRAACEQLEFSSVHMTFCSEAEYAALGEAGWLQRLGMQFHWQNEEYASFEDFLARLSANRRKVIKRERRDAQGAGLSFRTVLGSAVTREEWSAFFGFYQATVDKKWGSAYLTAAFFPLLGEKLGDAVVLMLAEKHGVPVAGALNLRGGDTLYGRNWGAVGEWPFLHFELCYYRAIDYAIAQGLKRVEAGAQGTHKIQRGYLPVPTYSVHWLRHAGLREAVHTFLQRERRAVEVELAGLNEYSPFKSAE